jgi:hypothetical protein
MTLGIFSRPGPSAIDPDLHLAMGQEMVLREFNAATVLDSFAPHPSTGSLRVPILSEKADTLHLTVLSDRNAEAFLKTVERIHSEAALAFRTSEDRETFENKVARGSWYSSISEKGGSDFFEVNFSSRHRQWIKIRKDQGPHFEVTSGWIDEHDETGLGEFYRTQRVSIAPDRGPSTLVYGMGMSGVFELGATWKAPRRPGLYQKILDRFEKGEDWEPLNGVRLDAMPIPFLALIAGRHIYHSKQFPKGKHKMEVLAVGEPSQREVRFPMTSRELREAVRHRRNAETALILARLDSLTIRMQTGSRYFSVKGAERDPIDETGRSIHIEIGQPEAGGLMPLVPELRETLWDWVQRWSGHA